MEERGRVQARDAPNYSSPDKTIQSRNGPICQIYLTLSRWPSSNLESGERGEAADASGVGHQARAGDGAEILDELLGYQVGGGQGTKRGQGVLPLRLRLDCGGRDGVRLDCG